MTGTWRSPWPQWRSHWHVLHAWPVSAQILLLIALTGGLIAVGSLLYSNDAWHAWWQAEEEAVAWQQTIDQLQTQVQAQQAQVQSLQGQAHPSGLNLPAWQLQPSAMPAHDLRSRWLQLAHTHGLQAPAALDDHSTVWVGSLPQLLAAWQQLPPALALHAVNAFELAVQPGSDQLVLSVTWLSWMDQAAPDKQSAWLPGSQRPAPPSKDPQALKVSVTAPATSEALVLHNPFAAEGLRMALPEAAHRAGTGVLRGKPVSEMHWVGMMQQGTEARALVAFEGQIHPVKLADAMGQDFGEVVQISPDHVLLSEWHANALGQWQLHTTRFPQKAQP